VEGCGSGNGPTITTNGRTNGRRDVVRGLFARELVWGDVDPHGGGLGACAADGGAIVMDNFLCNGQIIFFENPLQTNLDFQRTFEK
jgi:hypothetical protein